ncbi:MAG: queuosine precursor transporter [Candidatus Mcinerneyibacterium aminivorans]|uniref:Probable queuosine precursor transporter n=1 Tax=Candidatus Mcinerneyibacterium aminivorans TaxID=2703815 RepID=A0A5D0MMF4_9BACT|nr:MAG: queuosine precursor transporter [Candidatus Mcinerneyibacterium aminivorans]
MPNELLWILYILLDFIISLIIFKLFKKEGLFIIITINIILCNIQVIKFIKMFGITTTLGNLLYGGIFWATDMLSEIYGKKEAKKGVFIGFVTLFTMTIIMYGATLFKPASIDTMHPHIEAIFTFLPRIAFASLIAYLASQLHDVWGFLFLKEKTKGKHLWLRNNVSTITSQAIDSVVFTVIAFYGIVPVSDFIQILVTTYVFKLIVAVFDTPFLYLGRSLAVKMGEYFDREI